MSSMLYVFRWIPKDALLPQLVEHVQETCYGPHSITLGGVSNTNIVRNVSRVSNSSANNSHTHIGNTRQSEPQLKDFPRVHPLSRATTKGFLVFINCLEPQLKECHVFNPYLEPQLKWYVPSHKSRNTLESPPLRYHQSLVDHAHPKQTDILPLCYGLVEHLCR